MTADDIHAIRAGAVAIVAQCDAALARMAQAAAQPVNGFAASANDCQHARLISTGTMGSPLRQHCMDCDARVDKSASDLEPAGRI